MWLLHCFTRFCWLNVDSCNFSNAFSKCVRLLMSKFRAEKAGFNTHHHQMKLTLTVASVTCISPVLSGFQHLFWLRKWRKWEKKVHIFSHTAAGCRYRTKSASYSENWKRPHSEFYKQDLWLPDGDLPNTLKRQSALIYAFSASLHCSFQTWKYRRDQTFCLLLTHSTKPVSYLNLYNVPVHRFYVQ